MKNNEIMLLRGWSCGLAYTEGMTAQGLTPGEPMRAFWDTHQAQALCDEDDNGMQFLVLVDDGTRDDRPLVVWIHPGDACEHDSDDEEIRNNAADFERYMGLEIQELSETHRLVVLHRQSTPYAFEPDTWRVNEEYWTAMSEALENPGHIHLWGDDLDKASAWLLEQLGQAPQYFLTGAWTDPKYGCVTAVGKALVRAGKEVEVSGWSPSEPGSVADGWRPADEKAKMAAEAQAKAARKRKP
jgi:hypothetical protein